LSSFDPTAERPTNKCDPYGLQGESLSYAQCAEHMRTFSNETEVPDEEDETPAFLQKRYFHKTFHEMSQFLYGVSLVAEKINHNSSLSIRSASP